MKRFSLPSLAKIFKLTAPWAIVGCAGLFLSLADLTDAATPPGTWIQNQASATYTNSGVAVTSTSNAVSNMVAQAVSIVFDSETDSPIPGATVTLFNAETGAPARVYEADGVTTAPNTVVTGPDGGYNFDYVTAGTYRLQITPPPTHSAFLTPVKWLGTPIGPTTP